VLLRAIIRVVGILNLKTTTHGNKIANQPLMNSMVAGGCKSANAMYSKRGYQEPIIVIALILDHRNGHYVRPNRVALQYPNFKKDVDLNVHVRMFNFLVKKMQRLLKNISSMHLAIC